MSKPKPIPEGMHALTPHLTCAGADQAIEFYKKAFHAIEVMRLPGPDGKVMHAQLRIGDSVLMLADEFPEHCGQHEFLKGSRVTIHLCVENVDAVVEAACAAGATVTMPVADMFWGDRYGRLLDPYGHHWSVATHLRDMTPQEMMEAMGACMA